MASGRHTGSSCPPTLQITMRHLLDELISGDDVRAEAAIPALLEVGEPVIPALLELLHVPSQDTRWWTLCALSAFPSVDPAVFIPLLQDPSPAVRAAAALSLRAHPHPDSVSALITTLADPDSLTAGAAANALVSIGAPAVPDLLNLIQDAPVSVCLHALRALGEIRDHRAIPLLLQTAGSDSALLRYWAELALTRLGLDMVYIKP